MREARGWVGPERLIRMVASADASLLAVDRATAALPEVRLPLRLVGALDVGDTQWLAVVADADGRRWVVPLVQVRSHVRRARPGDGVAEALVAHLVRRPPTELGIEVITWRARSVRGERAITVDQTNESVVVGGSAVVKYVLHQPSAGEAAPAAALTRLRTLAETGFAGTPAPWGAVTMDVGEAAPLLLATVVDHLPGATDGWAWCVDDVRGLALGESSMAAAVEPAARIGALVSAMHLALSGAGVDVAGEDDARARQARAQADLDLAVESVTGPEGVRLRSWAPRAAAELAGLGAVTDTPVIDVHGDLHVGQVLRFADRPDYAVVDFDGNPIVPPDRRADRQPAAVDVAGMLASLDHVGRVVVHRTEELDVRGVETVETWIREARGAFLRAYREGLAAAGRPELLDERLLRPLLVVQECREYLYAVRHLPHWVYVPDKALPALLAEG